MRNHLGVHTGLAHPARDQLRVLRAEVDNKDWSLGICHSVSLKSDTEHTCAASPKLRTGDGTAFVDVGQPLQAQFDAGARCAVDSPGGRYRRAGRGGRAQWPGSGGHSGSKRGVQGPGADRWPGKPR